MSTGMIIIGLLVFLWIANSFWQHNNGNRIAFVGRGYIIHENGDIEKYGGLKDIIADSMGGVLVIGEQTYKGSFTPFLNGKREFTEENNKFNATVSKDNITRVYLKLSHN